jgi:hypothetical protein
MLSGSWIPIEASNATVALRSTTPLSAAAAWTDLRRSYKLREMSLTKLLRGGKEGT